MCFTRAGNPKTVKQHHWESEVEHQLSPGGPSNRRKLRSKLTKMSSFSFIDRVLSYRLHCFFYFCFIDRFFSNRSHCFSFFCFIDGVFSYRLLHVSFFSFYYRLGLFLQIALPPFLLSLRLGSVYFFFCRLYNIQSALANSFSLQLKLYLIHLLIPLVLYLTFFLYSSVFC